jgi:tetratricopeptide (TPR) repeat protein
MKHLLLIALLQIVPLIMATGQQNPGTSCDTAHSQALWHNAREAFDKHQYQAAAQGFSEAFRACPAHRDILIELSQAQAHLGLFDSAIRSARQFLDQEPKSIPGRVALANVYLMAVRLADAKREARGILEQEPSNLAAMKMEGTAEFLLGNVVVSESRFIELLDRYPNDEEGAYMLGRIYYQEGQMDRAIGQFERVLKVNPRSYKAYDNLGLCYEARGENDKAARHFWAAIRLADEDHSDYDWPFANLAELFLNEGDSKKAFALASQAAQRNPQSARNFYIGGRALYELQKTDLCLNWLQRSSALDPNYPEPLYLLAQVYRKLGDDGKAKEAEERFLEAKAKQPSHRR